MTDMEFKLVFVWLINLNLTLHNEYMGHRIWLAPVFGTFSPRRAFGT